MNHNAVQHEFLTEIISGNLKQLQHGDHRPL